MRAFGRLVIVDLRRLWSRRLPLWLLIPMIGILAALLWQGALNYEEATSGLSAPQRQCLAAQADARRSDPGADFHCDQIRSPTPIDFQAAMATQGQTAVYVLLAFGILVGASSTGYDLNTGALSTLLTFQPRRRLVLASRGVSAGLYSLGAALVLLPTFVFLLWSVYGRSPVPGEQPLDYLTFVLKGEALVLLGAALGAGLAVLMGGTAAVAALGVAYAVVEWAFPMQMESMGFLRPTNQIRGWLAGGTSYSRIDCTGEGCKEVVTTVPWGQSAAYILVIFVVGCALSLWSFSRRDVR